MKRIILVLVLFTLLVSISANIAMAGFGLEDPALCVAGKWLIVDAAAEPGVVVLLPRGVQYGDAGQCPPPPTGMGIYTGEVVQQIGGGHMMTVLVRGKQASEPSVTVTYGSDTFTKESNGRQTLVFRFALP